VAGLETKRWFRIEDLSNEDPYSNGSYDRTTAHGQRIATTLRPELILSYYKSPKSKEKSGWIFLSDVSSVSEDAASHYMILVHPSRTYRLRALGRNQHDVWLDTLCALCNKEENHVSEDEVCFAFGEKLGIKNMIHIHHYLLEYCSDEPSRS
jgi:hypothetical protein